MSLFLILIYFISTIFFNYNVNLSFLPIVQPHCGACISSSVFASALPPLPAVLPCSPSALPSLYLFVESLSYTYNTKSNIEDIS